jgi:hypothetical protein
VRDVLIGDSGGDRLYGGRGGPPDPQARLLHLLHSTASGDLAFYIQPPSTFVFTRFVEEQHCRRPLLLVVQRRRLV